MTLVTTHLRLSLTFFFLIPLLTNAQIGRSYINKNVVDRCWRNNPKWYDHRMDLAKCSVGFTGIMKQNRGKHVTRYVVTDNRDDPANPRFGTLRYGATMIPGKVWITFKCDTTITLLKPLFITNHTAIDGRGAKVYIAHGSGFVVHGGRYVIIHGLHFHDIKKTTDGTVVIPGGQVIPIKGQDLDAIRLVNAYRVWIDHNTLSDCGDGLIDITIASTRITVSNNLFREHEKVMLLGHHDSYSDDVNMRVTIYANHFGPNCDQRMPRIRLGYVHIVNNVYEGWKQYAIGGSMNPIIMSEGNRYTATDVTYQKAVAWKESGPSWHVKSIDDEFENGAIFTLHESESKTIPRYGDSQRFKVGSVKDLDLITKDAGALDCRINEPC